MTKQGKLAVEHKVKKGWEINWLLLVDEVRQDGLGGIFWYSEKQN